MNDTFRYMEALFQTWLARARVKEVLRLLDLVHDELGRRGFASASTLTPPTEKERED